MRAGGDIWLRYSPSTEKKSVLAISMATILSARTANPPSIVNSPGPCPCRPIRRRKRPSSKE